MSTRTTSIRSRPVAAKFPAKCPRCHDWVKVGQQIARAEDVQWKYAHFPTCETIDVRAREDMQKLAGGPPPTPPPTVMKEIDYPLLAKEVVKRLDELHLPPTTPPEVTEEQVGRIAAKILGEAVKLINRPTYVTIRRPDATEMKVEGPQHSLFPQLLYYISRRHNVYMWGPSQSGKSTAAMMAAKALGLEFYYLSLNPQTPDSRLMGYNDANGRYVDTVFHKGYEKGGVICLDEVDNSSSSLLTTMNSALANDRGSFPVGMVSRHKDCIVVATGNTPGRGGTPQFPERRPLDGAFMERFTFIHWGYDQALELELVRVRYPAGHRAIVEWVRAVRSQAETKGLRVMATPTSAMKLAEYAVDGTITPEQAVEAVVFKGVDKATKDQLLQAVPVSQLGAVWGKS